MGLAEAMEPEVKSAHRTAAMACLATDGENIRAALQWSLDAFEVADVEIGLRLAGALLFFWHLRGEISEGYEWVDALIERGRGAGPIARSRALHAAAELGWLVGRADLARTRAEEAAALFRDLGDMHRLAYTLQSLPMTNDNPHARESVAESLHLFRQVGDAWGTAMAMFAVDLFAATSDPIAAAQARAQLEEALPIWRELGDDWATAQLLNILGDIERSVGDDAAAASRYEEAITLLWRLGMDGTVPSLQHNLAYLALRRGDARRALRLFREALALFRDQGDQRGMADCLTGVACALTARGQHVEAARLLGTAEALRESIGASIWPTNREEYDRALASIRAGLGQGDLNAAFSAGRNAPRSAVVAEVAADTRDAPATSPTSPVELTEREREVAVLVAEGLTNRQIGARLFITEGTARLHVKHVLQKRGFSSRAQIAAWVVEQGLTSGPPSV
jgi:non-specific serine/threonine protein kinase